MASNQSNTRPEAGIVALPARARPRLKWHHIYYILAAFDLATISFSLYLNHRILAIYEDSVAVNQEWAERSSRYSDLAQLVARINAPGNDVFATRDVERESARLSEALARFDTSLAQARTNLGQLARGEVERALLERLDRVEMTAREMVSESELIFASLRVGDTNLAGVHMAEMDRRYGRVRSALDDLQNDVRQIQEGNFEFQTAAAVEIGRYEYLIGALIVVIVSAVTWYGHKLARKLEADQKERERFLEELEATETLTRRYNEELEGTVRERTEGLRRAQRDLLRSERLAAVGEMAAAIAHGIRNPLASIRAAAEVGREDAADATMSETLNDIVTEVSRLEGRIRTVLDFSNSSEPELTVGDINEFLDTFAKSMDKRIPRLVRLEVSKSPDVEPFSFDRDRVTEILEALVVNAIEAVGGAGTITIRSGYDVDAAGGRPRVVVSVLDTGPGIDPERLGHIFDLFYTTKPSGTGIGLAMAKRLVDAHGGTIEVDSRPGGRTAFHVKLPAQESSETVEEPT